MAQILESVVWRYSGNILPIYAPQYCQHIANTNCQYIANILAILSIFTRVTTPILIYKSLFFLFLKCDGGGGMFLLCICILFLMWNHDFRKTYFFFVFLMIKLRYWNRIKCPFKSIKLPVFNKIVTCCF